MNLFRMSVIAIASGTAAIASSQSLPPPPFAGQSYWFGPGPQSYNVVSSGQNSGGYAEQYQSGGSYVAGVSGGPAFVGSAPNGTNLQDIFSMTTSVVVTPYIYIDGYFGVTATITGFTAPSTPINVGTSRFFVLHNGSINVFAFGQGLVSNGSSYFTPSSHFTFSDYTNPSNYSNSQNLGIGGIESVGVTVDPTIDEGILQVDIERNLTPGPSIVTGTYTGTATVVVQSL